MDEGDLRLELNVIGQPSLIPGRDYFLGKVDGEGLILKLFTNLQWADLTSRVPPLGLILWSVKFKGMKTNLLLDPIIVAQVLKIPAVHEVDIDTGGGPVKLLGKEGVRECCQRSCEIS